MPFLDFSTSGQNAQGQLKVFSAQFAGTMCCASVAVCPGNYTFFQRQGRLPKVATKPVRSSSSVTTEPFFATLLLSCQRLGTSQTHKRMGASSRPTNRQHPPNAGSDEHHRDFSCYGVPLRARDGYPLLRGQAAGPDLSSARRKLGHCGLRFGRAGRRLQPQYGVFLGMAPRHIWVQSLSGRACYAMGVGLRLRPSQCVRDCPATDRVRQC